MSLRTSRGPSISQLPASSFRLPATMTVAGPLAGPGLRIRAVRHPARHQRHLRHQPSLHPGRRGGRQSLSAHAGTNLTAAEVAQLLRSALGVALAVARADPPAVGQLRRGDDLGRRRRRHHPRHRPHAGRAGVRHRRLAAEGAQYACSSRARPPSTSCRPCRRARRASCLAPTSATCSASPGSRWAGSSRSRRVASAIWRGHSTPTA